MKGKISISILSLLISIEISCTRTQTQQNGIIPHLDSNNVLVYVKDSSLYLFNQSKDSTQFIKTLKPRFVRFSLMALSDSVVTIGYYGNNTDSAFSKKDGTPLKCPCSESDSLVLRQVVGSLDYDQFEYEEFIIEAINIYSKKSWIYKTVNLKHSYQNQKPTETKIYCYDFNGKIISIKDSVFPTPKWPFSKNPLYMATSMDNYDFNLKYIKGMHVESCDGSLYLCKKDTNELLLMNNNPGHFKAPPGNYWPDISPDASKVVFIKMAGGFEIYQCETPPKNSGMHEIDIPTRKISTLISQNANYPLYSPGGKYILFLRNLKICKNDRLVYEIDIFDRTTKNITLVGTGDSYTFYTWMKPMLDKTN